MSREARRELLVVLFWGFAFAGASVVHGPALLEWFLRLGAAS